MPSVTVGDSDLAYEQSGAGPDVVWIAGGGDNGASWRRWQTPAFDDAFRSTTFANRGVGDPSAGRSRRGRSPIWRSTPQA